MIDHFLIRPAQDVLEAAHRWVQYCKATSVRQPMGQVGLYVVLRDLQQCSQLYISTESPGLSGLANRSADVCYFQQQLQVQVMMKMHANNAFHAAALRISTQLTSCVCYLLLQR